MVRDREEEPWGPKAVRAWVQHKGSPLDFSLLW